MRTSTEWRVTKAYGCYELYTLCWDITYCRKIVQCFRDERNISLGIQRETSGEELRQVHCMWGFNLIFRKMKFVLIGSFVWYYHDGVTLL